MAELFQVEFKGSRREFFYNTYYHSLEIGSHVITQVEQGEDIGLLTKQIDKEIDFSKSQKPRSILRPASVEDVQKMHRHRENEVEYKKEMITLVRKHGLVMKVVDVECQFDGNKITFYFTADHRVDFRALVRDLASRYRTRIELRQIGVRDEARRIDGYGICGQRQCCNGPVVQFAPISTQHARDQDLSLNPSKISGNCGRLLCCLRYEVDAYRETKKQFPSVGASIRTSEVEGTIERIDVFTEEAVVIDEERTRHRVRAGDIIDVLQDKGRRRQQPSSQRDDADVDPDELKKLDDANGR